MAYLAVENLTFSFPGSSSPSLAGVSAHFEQGSYTAVCGTSGCGKTTLLRHLKPALVPHGTRSGKVFYEGAPLEALSQRDAVARIGYVMQSPDDQIVTDRVWHELAFGLESLGMDPKQMRVRVAEMASYFGIASWFNRDVSELSGGQKQLLNLASVMAMQPDVLVLDEPTSQLDPIAASNFLNTVRKINLELGTTVVISEHRLEEVLPVADQVIVLSDGTVAACGTPREVGQQLNEMGDAMVDALPAPMRIYYGIDAGRRRVDPENCPLTVREGRNWLPGVLSKADDGVGLLAEGRPYEEGGFAPVLEAKELWLRYEKDGSDVLKGLSFELEARTLHAVVGGNGAGKSTLLKALCGLERPFRGAVKLQGRKLKPRHGSAHADIKLALLPQDPLSLLVGKTVRADLEETLDERRGRGQELLSEIAALCHVESLFNRHPYDLSGGEQQRVALAKVLLVQPDVLLLDEPTKGMDSAFKQEFAVLLKQLLSKGVTVLMASHDIEFCARYASRVSMLFDGQIVSTNTARRFFSSNGFYTTAANRMSRHVVEGAVTVEDVVGLCKAK